MADLKQFKFWCYKVLPLVYDESLSYYEVLCKTVDYINSLIEQDVVFGDELAELKKELNTVQTWIDNFDTSYAENIIKDNSILFKLFKVCSGIILAAILRIEIEWV